MSAVSPTTVGLLDRLLGVRRAALSAEASRQADIDALPPQRRLSPINLIHYLALRDVDLRDEQRSLAQRGLSSLGRAEAHILATLDAVIERVGADVAAESLGKAPALPDDLGQRGPTAQEGRDRLRDSAIEALGPAPLAHSTRVMVTLPSEAAVDPTLVEGYVLAGMSIARINGAHDGPEAWRAMAANVSAAAAAHDREVKIAFDLAGPKLRTGPIAPGPAVLKVRPKRDEYGRVVQPARIVFAGPNHVESTTDELPVVPVDDDVIAGAEPGDELRLRDARGRSRKLRVAHTTETAIEVTTDRTVYFVPGLDVVRKRSGRQVATGRVGGLPLTPGFLDLRAGDLLELRAGDRPGRSAKRTADGAVIDAAHVSVDVPELYGALSVGDRVLIDDGTIHAVVRTIDTDRVGVEIMHPDRAKLRAEKGINLPDVHLAIAALSPDDVEALEVAVSFSDMVAFSFVGDPDDVRKLHRELDRLGRGDIGVVLKIEHRTAFERFPDLLLAALSRPRAAVMVARGDLAVEIGYSRLAEVQEEILWLCEAAHVPVIWATQVLENLAKRGAPTRAEVTDAAWSSRAECVMLNKGPYIADTIRFLDNVLTRMHEHQSKRTPMLRRLSIAGGTQATEV